MTAQPDSRWDALYGGETPVPVQQPALVWEPSALALTTQVDSVFQKRAEGDIRANRIPGFRILVYTGNEREGTNKIKETLYREFPKADLYVTYQAPTFKVKMGDFYRKLDAYLFLRKMQEKFPMAVLVPEIVNLKP